MTLPSTKIRNIAKDLAFERGQDFHELSITQRNIFMTSALILYLDNQSRTKKGSEISYVDLSLTA